MFLPFISDYKGYIAHEGRTKIKKTKKQEEGTKHTHDKAKI